MSFALAPRDKSFTGFFNPRMTGPIAWNLPSLSVILYEIFPVLISGNTKTFAGSVQFKFFAFLRIIFKSKAASN